MLYFDNAATTKVNEEVIADIVYALRNDWVNPSSISTQGMEVKQKIEHARKQIADYINAEPEEIIFTASGSEANNFAIKGIMYGNEGFNCILSTKIEHPSVYNTCEYLKNEGFYRVEYAPVDAKGVVDKDKFINIIDEITDDYSCLVSIMMANNEIGTIQPIKDLAYITHYYQGIIHTDATQAFGKIPIDVKVMDIDLMSVGLHKIGLPKGIGFLYKRKSITLSPIIHGGHQEMDLRAGTENVAYIIAAGNQVERMNGKQYSHGVLCDCIYNMIYEKCYLLNIYMKVNGSLFDRLPNVLSLTFNGIDAEALITLLDMNGVQVSAGAACCSGEKTHSRVLKAIGLSDEDAFSTIRISIGEDTTIEECEKFVGILGECLRSLKMMG